MGRPPAPTATSTARRWTEPPCGPRWWWPGSMWTDVVVTAGDGQHQRRCLRRRSRGSSRGNGLHRPHAQTSGRGRLDRSWDSAPGSGIAVSVVLRPDAVPPARWVWLPLLVGLAVDATVHDLGVDSGLEVAQRRARRGPQDRRHPARASRDADGRRCRGRASGSTSRCPARSCRSRRPPRWRWRAPRRRTAPWSCGRCCAIWRRCTAPGSSSEGDPAAGIRDAYLRRCVTVGSSVRVQMPDGTDLVGSPTPSTTTAGWSSTGNR